MRITLGLDYDRTLMEWHSRFERAWPDLQGRYGALLGGRFKRMFEFYLLMSAGFVRIAARAGLADDTHSTWCVAASVAGAHEQSLLQGLSTRAFAST